VWFQFINTQTQSFQSVDKKKALIETMFFWKRDEMGQYMCHSDAAVVVHKVVFTEGLLLKDYCIMLM